MKLRYISFVVLAAWYLVAPGDKFVSDSGGGLMATQWIRLGTFQTKAECERARKKVEAKVAKEYQADRDAHRELGYHLGDAADCVPQLKNSN